jgi:hypothetical protein
MKTCAFKKVAARLLLLLAMAMLAAGCYWGPGGYPEDPGPGYYGGYPPAFYGGDVVIGVGGHGGEHHDEGHRDVSHMPGRRLPAPAPRPMAHPHPAPERR